jgi:hypothetical protein
LQRAGVRSYDNMSASGTYFLEWPSMYTRASLKNMPLDPHGEGS